MGCLNLRSLLIRPVGGTADDDVDSNCLLTTVFCALRAAPLAVPVSPVGVPGGSPAGSAEEAAALVLVALVVRSVPNQSCWTCLWCGFHRSDVETETGPRFLNDDARLSACQVHCAVCSESQTHRVFGALCSLGFENALFPCPMRCPLRQEVVDQSCSRGVLSVSSEHRRHLLASSCQVRGSAMKVGLLHHPRACRVCPHACCFHGLHPDQWRSWSGLRRHCAARAVRSGVARAARRFQLRHWRGDGE
jgi:hypothetical protein